MACSVFGGMSYNVSTIFAKSCEKSHRLWTKNLSLARGLLALKIKIPSGIHFLGPWEGGKLFYLFFLVTLTSPPGHPRVESQGHLSKCPTYCVTVQCSKLPWHHCSREGREMEPRKTTVASPLTLTTSSSPQSSRRPPLRLHCLHSGLLVPGLRCFTNTSKSEISFKNC